MPNWGLDRERREPDASGRTPWGLDEKWLRPSKVVTDPVHGDIYLNCLETALVSSPPMRRLARVRQLGMAHLVYPGAVHTRLAHSLGTLRAAQDLLDAVADARNRPHPPEREYFSTLTEPDRSHKIAEATVAARLGALLHDFCHVPIGHTIEDDLRVLTPHDGNVERFDGLWSTLPDEPREAIERADGGALMDEIRPLILSKEGEFEVCTCCRRRGAHKAEAEVRYPFVADIVGNTICADLMDYLRRDHYYCGLPIGLGSRFVSGFYVMDDRHVHFPRKMVVQISRDGQRREDVLSELVKCLRYRYELSERVLIHHAKTAADAMISKMLEMWVDELFVTRAESELGEATIPARARRSIGDVRRRVAETTKRRVVDRNGEEVSAAVWRIDERVRGDVEEIFRTSSDDGILERLADGRLDVSVPAPQRTLLPSGSSKPRQGTRAAAVATLARDLLDRRLYKTVAVAGGQGDRALAKEIYKEFGSAPRRRDLERQAMSYAGLSPSWHLVLWVPEPKMRMKVAQVLCDDDGHVAPLSAIADNDSAAVLEQHRRLWSVVVYAHPLLREPDTTAGSERLHRLDAALAYLRDAMDLDLHRWDGQAVPTRRHFVVERVGEVLSLSRKHRDELAAQDDAVAALGHRGQRFDQLPVDKALDLVYAQGLAIPRSQRGRREPKVPNYWK